MKKLISVLLSLMIMFSAVPSLNRNVVEAAAYPEISSDPMHTSDAEFFGVWNGSSWTTQPKLAYGEVSALSAVESAVKSNNYALAKSELLNYAKNKTPILNPGHRDTNLANLIANGFAFGPYYNFYQGSFSASAALNYYSTSIAVSDLHKATLNSFRLVAVENSEGAFKIYSKENSVNKTASLELVVNGTTRTYYACADSQITAGSSKNSVVTDNGYLSASTNGAFLGDGTSHILLNFDLSDISESDVISSAKVTVYGQVVDFSQNKTIYVMREPDSSWNESGVTWSGLLGLYYNYNGISEGITWERPGGDDIEYLYQLCRFNPWPALCYEYVATQNEMYAQAAISIMLDFINDKGTAGTVKGQFPRTLDTAERFQKWTECVQALATSESITPDAMTAIYKHIYDMGHSFMENRSQTGENWEQNEMTKLYNYSAFVPELTESTLWIDTARNELLAMYTQNNNPDGSYVEGTTGYNVEAMRQFIQFKQSMPNEYIGAENDEMMLKAAYYNRLMHTPDGRSLQWGDSGLGGATNSEVFPQIYEWYGDEEFLYIDSFGRKGEKPNWTSKVYYDNRTTTMRSSWDRDALFMFTNVRGGGDHSNGDDNHVFVSAYGRPLLTDTGIMSYTGGSDEKNYAVATIGHNTVEIDGTSQVNCHFNPDDYNYPGTIHDWESDKNYDFISQTAMTNRVKTTFSGTKTIEHKRSVLFVKPFGFIVSDFMTPYNSYTNHEYKQLWHMLPEAKLSASNGVIKSNFASGANILVASADSDATTSTGDGWFDYSYNQISQIKHGYFYKKQRGNTTFDTVIMPSQNDANATLDVERISLDVATTTATSLKYTSVADGKTNIGYYYLSYEGTPSVRTFGEFETDASLAFVNTDANGNVNMVILKDGSYVSKNGVKLVDMMSDVETLSLTISGSKCFVETTSSETPIIKINGVSDTYINTDSEHDKFVFDNVYVSKPAVTTSLPHRDEEYNDGVVNGNRDDLLTTDGGTITESDGWVHLTRTTENGRLSNCHYVNGSYPINGNIFAEFKLKKNRAETECEIRFLQADTVYLKWDSDSKLYGMYRNNPEESECTQWKYICDIPSLEAEFYINLNTDSDTYSIWLDDKLVLANAYSRTSTCDALDYFGVFTESGEVGDVISIDYMRGGIAGDKFIPVSFEIELTSHVSEATFTVKGINAADVSEYSYLVALLDEEGTLIGIDVADSSDLIADDLIQGFGKCTIQMDTSHIYDDVYKYKVFVVKNHAVVASLRKIR